MGRANQPVRRRAQLLRSHHQRDHVCLAIGHVHQPRARQVRRRFRHALVTFDPALALLDATAFALRVLRLTCPHPRIEHTQRQALGRHRVGRMQVHPALCLVRQRTKPCCLPTVEVQFRGVLQAQHHRVRCHAPFGLPPMRFQNRFPLNLVVVEEAVRRDRLAPVPACLWHAGRRLGCQSFHQCPRSLVQARVAKGEVCKFSFRPARGFQVQGVHAKIESKREAAPVYKP